MVGRPREFNEEKVLDAAMKAFWANGYEGTSLADLVSATGLHKGSLYQAFGDKHTLFLTTLNRYLANIRQQKNRILAAAETPLAGIRELLHRFVDMADGEADCPQGCMFVKALVEIAPHDPEVRRIVESHRDTMQESIQGALRLAQDRGELDRGKSPRLITAVIMIFMSGLAAQATGPMAAAEAHALLDAQLDSLI